MLLSMRTQIEAGRALTYEAALALDNGDTISVVQEADQVFVVDDRVRLLKQKDGTTRVAR